jgi:hypothetical protein
MTLKFESEIFVKTFDKDFERTLINIGCTEAGFGKIAKIEHTVNINNSPVIPDDKFIETLKNNIFEALTESLTNQTSINAEVKGVEFIGITKIQQKENT